MCYYLVEIFSVITSPEGRRRVMQLANEVVKDFSQILAMSSKLDNIPKYFIDADDSGVRFCLRNNTNSSIVIVASSISLPIPSHIVFNFLKDPARRFQVQHFFVYLNYFLLVINFNFPLL